MKGAVFHDLLSSGFTGESINLLALEVKPTHLAWCVLGVLKLYRCTPRERIRLFLSTSPDQMDAMLRRENQGLLSTAITIDQLWDRYRVSWIEVRRLEIELGAGGDHDCPYTWSIPPSGTQVLAWKKLLARRDRGEFEP
jgi:hypothetical protein